MSDWKNVQYKNGKMRTSESGGGGSSHTYSTTEQVVGTWVDGKPIYEITIELPSYVTISNTDWTSIGILASSLNVNKFIHCTAYTSTGTCWEAINVANINGNIALTAWRNGDTINVDAVVLQYTKTTD